MKTTLTLQEKLRDLRDEHKLKLQDVADATGIPLATLGRIESNDDNQTSYQTVAVLAKFYNVSADYLFGVTDNRQHRNIEIDALSLSDSAIEVLKSKKLNNRLVSELLSHEDFQQLINAIEVYIDKKMLPQMQVVNAVYRLAETTIKENFNTNNINDGTNDSVDNNDNNEKYGNNTRDEILNFLQNSIINEDEYLRYRISERFNEIMKSLFEAHKKDALSPEHNEVIEDMKNMIQGYASDRKTEPENKSKAILLCKQLGLNTSKLDDEEWKVLMGVLERSPVLKRGGRRR